MKITNITIHRKVFEIDGFHIILDKEPGEHPELHRVLEEIPEDYGDAENGPMVHIDLHQRDWDCANPYVIAEAWEQDNATELLKYLQEHGEAEFKYLARMV